MARWKDYFMERAFGDFWSDLRAQVGRQPIIIMGLGFDPRSIRAFEVLLSQKQHKPVGRILFDFKGAPAIGERGRLTEELKEQNRKKLQELSPFIDEGTIEIKIHDSEGNNVAGRLALKETNARLSNLAKYSDIIIDISGMPRSVFFPLISFLLKRQNQGVIRNIHVAILEDANLDARIIGQEYGRAEFYDTFRAHAENKLVWLPILGHSAPEQLRKIHEFIGSRCTEICPILPFPSIDPRRGDSIIVSVRDILFSEMEVIYDNVFYCDERIPFDVYRKILTLEEYYRNELIALSDLGRVDVVVSPLSSKTLSLGVLLAAVERNLSVCSVNPGAYIVEAKDVSELALTPEELPTEIWLAGDPFTKAKE